MEKDFQEAAICGLEKAVIHPYLRRVYEGCEWFPILAEKTPHQMTASCFQSLYLVPSASQPCTPLNPTTSDVIVITIVSQAPKNRSMEALAAVGLVANVVQFIDFGAELYARINDLSSGAGKAPGKIRNIANRLSFIIDTLKSLDQESLTAVNNNTKILEACSDQVKELDCMVAKFTVQENKDEVSHWQKGVKKVEKSWKAFKSIRADDKIEELEKGLDRLLDVLSLQLQARTA